MLLAGSVVLGFALTVRTADQFVGSDFPDAYVLLVPIIFDRLH
jgi:hypothetical protein